MPVLCTSFADNCYRIEITDKDQDLDVQILVSVDTSDVCKIYPEEPIVSAGKQVEGKDTRMEFDTIVVQEEGIVVTEDSPRSLSPEVQWSASGGLWAPEIHIQAASPVPMSMSDQEEEAFVPQQFTDAPPAVAVTDPGVDFQVDRADDVDEAGYEEADRYHEDRVMELEEYALPIHKPLGITISLEAQRDSQPSSDVESQEEGHFEEERPLSPTDYILEPEGEVEGRIASDTSQQIFIEQSIEAAREHAQQEEQVERPPSPSDFTLMTESQELVFTSQRQEPLHDAHSPGTNQTHASI